MSSLRLRGPQAQIETGPPLDIPRGSPRPADVISLHIVWSACEPHRVGHSAECVPNRTMILGRAPHAGRDEVALEFREPRTVFSAALDEPNMANSELLGQALSRRQLELMLDGDALLVRNVGRCPLWVNGTLTGRARVVPGDTIHLQQQLLLLCTQRRPLRAALYSYPTSHASMFAFGGADADGIVGEGSAIWHLREQLDAVARCEGHVLVLGESGVGKELAARGLHSLSPRRARPFIAENVATLPATLGAALLFGNRRNFPNPGMAERAGLIGSAEGGSLFLDELGDMAKELQPMLLRVMDRGATYIRLGDDSQTRRANVRFIGATNHPERLSLELRRRFQHEVVVPSLNERQEDIPLLARHLLLGLAARQDEIERFFEEGHLRIDPRLLDQLVRHRYTTQVSELAFLLECALRASHGEVLTSPAEDLRSLRASALDAPLPELHQKVSAERLASTSSSIDIQEERRLPNAEQAQEALDAMGGSVVGAAAKLGITRHQLNRLIRRQSLRVSRS